MEKEKELKVFEYEGKPITFDFDEGQKMVNATQMAKSFPSKKVAGFLRLKQTKEFIEILNSRYADSHHGSKYKAFRVIQGGTPELQGTWMEERLALKFAGWLNAHFEMWVYDRILELLNTGKTEINPKPITNLKTLEFVFQKIKDNAMEIHYLSDIIEDLKKLEKEED